MGQRDKKEGYQHWNTPTEILDPLSAFLPISLDPCSNSTSIVPAQFKVQPPDDGLAIDWHRFGHTFVNPPYKNQLEWLAKAIAEIAQSAKTELFDATITFLIPASPETDAFRRYVFGHADAVAFWRRRVKFTRADGGGGGNTLPSALVYFGPEKQRFAEHFSEHATVITEWQEPPL